MRVLRLAAPRVSTHEFGTLREVKRARGLAGRTRRWRIRRSLETDICHSDRGNRSTAWGQHQDRQVVDDASLARRVSRMPPPPTEHQAAAYGYEADGKNVGSKSSFSGTGTDRGTIGGMRKTLPPLVIFAMLVALWPGQHRARHGRTDGGWIMSRQSGGQTQNSLSVPTPQGYGP